MMQAAASPRARTMLAAACTMALMLASLSAPERAAAGTFAVDCAWSHSSHDDPIVHAGMPGTSHLHDFYGATSAWAKSTYESMVASRSTCSDRRDTAGYWHPHLTVDGRSLTARVTAWYSRGGKATVRPFPRGIKLLAGNPMAMGIQSRRVLWWRCAGPDGAGASVRLRRPPTCGARTRLTAELAFPDCWNGRELDSATHRAHVRYARHGRCPATHPYGIPRLVLQVTWPTRASASQLSLASGSWMTMHADFWNTWNQRRLRALTNQCLNINDDCGVIGRRPPRP